MRFWGYLISAIDKLQPAVGEKAQSLLHSPQPYSTESVLTVLINDVAGLSDDFVIILDDYYVITSEAINAGSAFLLEHLPPNMHLILTTRTDPALPLAHFRGRGTLLELRADDLRFTEQEAMGLLKEMLGYPLPSEAVGALNERTEGWAVGFKMAALSLNEGANVSSFVNSFTSSQRYIMDYLVEEVLKRQPDDMRRFLLRTSVLEKLNASLCDYVAECNGSQEMLLKLEQSNLFITPLDETRRWYRYHNLFADLLRDQLMLTSGPDEVWLLHQRASHWYEERRLTDEAVHHSLEAKDWNNAIRLARAQSEEIVGRGELSTLLNWMRPIPDEVLRKDLRLYCRYASALQTAGQFEAAETALAYLERTAQEEPELQGEVAVLQAGLANLRGDEARSIELAEKALNLLPPDSFALRSTACFLLGALQKAPSEKAQALLAESWNMGRKGGNHYYAAGAQSSLGFNLFLQGHFTESESATQAAIDYGGAVTGSGCASLSHQSRSVRT